MRADFDGASFCFRRTWPLWPRLAHGNIPTLVPTLVVGIKHLYLRILLCAKCAVALAAPSFTSLHHIAAASAAARSLHTALCWGHASRWHADEQYWACLQRPHFFKSVLFSSAIAPHTSQVIVIFFFAFEACHHEGRRVFRQRPYTRGAPLMQAGVSTL